MQLQALTLKVDDLTLAQQFYQQVLGLTLIDGSVARGELSFLLEPVVLVLRQVDGCRGCDSGLVIAVDDFMACLQRWNERGDVRFTGALRQHDHGRRCIELLDPAQNRILIVEATCD